MYQYPYGNAQQLNLDWILSKLQELESGSGGGTDLEEVANALVSASFDTTIPYRKYDYAFYDGKLYRALNDTIGAFNPSDWLEVTLGADIPVLTRLVNADSALITTLQNMLQNLGSDDVANESNATGTNVSDALDTLNGAINDVQGQISAYVETGNTSSRAYAVGEYLVWKGDFYRVKTAITSSGITFTPGTNIEAKSIGAEIASSTTSAVTLDTTNTTAGTFNLSRCGNILIIDGFVTLNGNVAGNDKTLVTFPTGFRPTTHRYFRVYATYGGNVGFYQMRLNTDGTLITSTGGSVFSGQVIFPSVTILI